MGRHNPYFNRWFSAINNIIWSNSYSICHNPYFNRWFSAIEKEKPAIRLYGSVTILILIDGFLQWKTIFIIVLLILRSQSLF